MSIELKFLTHVSVGVFAADAFIAGVKLARRTWLAPLIIKELAVEYASDVVLLSFSGILISRLDDDWFLHRVLH